MNSYIPYDGDKNDLSGFKAKARKHQAAFREKIMEEDCTDPYGCILPVEAGQKGANFHPGFGILEAVNKRYKSFRQPLFCHILRSEHIPFNFFIPLKQHKDVLKKLLNHYLHDTVEKVMKLDVEYAPAPFTNYLNDRTSFDSFLTYEHINGTQGIIGIEVKYTEHSYPLGHKERLEVNNPSGIYFKVSQNSGLYKEGSMAKLKQDKYRQIWRNHLLGERILEVDAQLYRHFTLITLYPAGNTYMHSACMEYKELLNDEFKDKFLPLTYESFLKELSSLVKDGPLEHWTQYLNMRYIVTQ